MPDVFISSSVSKKAHRTKNPGVFSSFSEYPGGISFQSQDEDEIILLFARRHFITNLPWIIITVFLLILPGLGTIAISLFAQAFFELPAQFTAVLLIFYYLVIFGYVLVNFMHWFYNILIVTQKEIVDIDFSHLVYHDVAATKVSLVEDVNYTQSGFIRGLFNYGDVFVQTAGGKENIEALAIPKPARAAKIVLNLIGDGGNQS